MKILQILIGIAAFAGLLSGPGVLEAAEAATPPITWSDIPFVFAGSVLGIFLVVGFQVFIGKKGPARFASWFFGLAGIYTSFSGISALIVAKFGAGINPSALFFLAIGIGMMIGAVLAGAAYRAKFKS